MRKEMLDGRVAVYDNGVVTKVVCGKEEALYPHKSSGYYGVCVDGKNYRIHRLVAEAFVDNPYNKSIVNHKDGNRANNSASNLEWVTPSENIQHAYNIGAYKKERKSNKLCEHRLTIGITDSQYNELLNMRTFDEFKRCSISDIFRQMFLIGIKEYMTNNSKQGVTS